MKRIRIAERRFFRVARRGFFFVAFGFFSVLGSLSPSPAERQADLDRPPLPVCTGFDPERGRWGPVRVNSITSEDRCPRGYAFMASEFIAGRWEGKEERIPIEGYCCPLPCGVLTDEQVEATLECPENFVVTGARWNLEKGFLHEKETSPLQLICTKIDTREYRLGEAAPGWTVGWEREVIADTISQLISEVPVRYTTWNRLPAALRSGIFRLSQDTIRKAGCIGFPWGSLMVARKGKECSALFFRPLLRKAKGEQPESLAAIYPECSALDDELSPAAKCAADSRVLPASESRNEDPEIPGTGDGR